MPRYRVHDGAVVAHGGAIHEGGAVLELSRAIAEDSAVRGMLQAVDENGRPIDLPEPDDLEVYRAHERVSLLRAQIAEAERRLDTVRQRLRAEEQQLLEAVSTLQPDHPIDAADAIAVKE